MFDKRTDVDIDIDKHPDYFTPKGKVVMAWIIAKTADSPPTPNELAFWKTTYDGRKCYSWERTTDGKSLTAIVFLYQDGSWRFDDLFIDTAEGIDFKIYASDLKDKPLRTFVARDWRVLKHDWSTFALHWRPSWFQ